MIPKGPLQLTLGLTLRVGQFWVAISKRRLFANVSLKAKVIKQFADIEK